MTFQNSISPFTPLLDCRQSSLCSLRFKARLCALFTEIADNPPCAPYASRPDYAPFLRRLPTILLVLLTLQGQIMRPFYGEQIVPCNKSHCPPILEYTRLEFLRHHEDRMASDQIYIPFLFTKDLDGVEPSFPAICLLECSFQFRAEDQPFIHLLSFKLKNIQLKAISDSSTAPRFSNPIEFE